ncbi:MAG: N-acetyl-gamma-glutamyl-phosphate reductase [Fimbriimonadales bacterium]|jgi:N-acetyl-gamma-glutamyl-phosphate reductase|nr:N-acetyl-gamma-glutamyl-phosphate reductase [Fimbriimonadales bacterium]GBC90021.1 N-acetyl-gamma-glutamyl-phosphate reductase [bacterium HR14]GIV13483.1 MAG: N-acetyl-gamma-glutamyl-phosphate reductase [Fimbriimonadales bacterium]CUU05547.1 N-acetyl-gamma-glutamyl-phosphate reductase [Armatimonadetes bacterium GBS]CUU36164.1 N-acetyl-gamma-glutamyl-phosphate reductase [Armatimonadetes bacterium GXS]
MKSLVQVGIVGATGYTGSELVRLLSQHPRVQITALTSRSEAGKPLSAVLPHLHGLTLPPLTAYDPDTLAEKCEVVFLAGETGFAMEHAPELLERGVKVIDLSADFRLKEPGVFQEWYGKTHTAPHLLNEALYGLPELTPVAAYASARLIANPGCYPTASALALAPLLQADLVDSERIVVDAKSGVSGAGRSRVSVDYLFTELDENFKAYAVEKHRHTPEMEQTLQGIARRTVRIRFTPHLVPMTRGILATAYAPLTQPVALQDLHALYSAFYANQPFVQVRPLGEFPATRDVYGSNRCDIGLTIDARTRMAVVISVIDNLVKGAAGQAIQNLNLLMGWEPTSGLPLAGMAP